jgi:hypothetical protein
VKVAILLFAMALGAFGQRPAFTVDDLRIWRTPGDPRIRADGVHIIYTEEFQERSSLWLATADGRERGRKAPGATGHPDGRLAASASPGSRIGVGRRAFVSAASTGPRPRKSRSRWMPRRSLSPGRRMGFSWP